MAILKVYVKQMVEEFNEVQEDKTLEITWPTTSMAKLKTELQRGTYVKEGARGLKRLVRGIQNSIVDHLQNLAPSYVVVYQDKDKTLTLQSLSETAPTT